MRLSILLTCFLFSHCVAWIARPAFFAPSFKLRLYASKPEQALQSGLIEEMSAIRKQLHQSTPLQDDPLLPVVKHIAKSADLRKAIGVTAKRVSHLTEVTQFMVTIEGSNARQLQAIAGTIEDDVKENFSLTPYNKEGTAPSGWLVLDYGSVMVHIMSTAMKNFYKLEQRWAQGEEADLSDVIAVRETRVGNEQSLPEDTDDVGFTWLDEVVEHPVSGRDAHSAGLTSSRPRRGRTPKVSAPTPTVSAEDVAFWGSEEAAEAAVAAMPVVAEVKEVPRRTGGKSTHRASGSIDRGSGSSSDGRGENSSRSRERAVASGKPSLLQHRGALRAMSRVVAKTDSAKGNNGSVEVEVEDDAILQEFYGRK